jgi:hypothetical protein
MSRPSPIIILQAELDDGSVWDILQTTTSYIITYKDQPCGIRQHNNSLSNPGFRYQKLSYNNLGNARAQVNRLNTKFNCTDFDVRVI